MNVFQFFKEAVITAVNEMIQAGKLPDGLDLSRITVAPPKEADHGDLAVNAAMVLAKPANMPPKVLAELMGESFRQFPDVIHVEIDDDGSARVWAEAE